MPRISSKLATLVCLAVIVGALVPLAFGNWVDRTITLALGGIRGLGVMGAGALLLLQFLAAATGVLPASIVAAAAGMIYGFLWGTGLAAVGTMAGAVAGFHLGRRGLRQLRFVPKRILRPLRSAERFVAADGWKTVFLIRLSPVMPFAATSMAFGASGLGERDFLVGTLASLPALLGYVYAGSLLGAEESLTSLELNTVLVWALAAGSIAAVTVIGRFILYLYRAETPPKRAQES